MNLPAINNKMKNHNNPQRQDTSPGLGGFGLGIQVFKIQSVKNIDSNFKSKNRTAIKNIENPIIPNTTKPSFIPKPKKLPSLEKSNSQINSKDRFSAFIASKIQPTSHQGLSDKINQRKQPNIQKNTTMTLASYSMRKKVGVSTEKNILNNQTAKAFQLKNLPHQKQKSTTKGLAVKLNQTAPPETMYKAEELYYVSYHSQHEFLNKFYLEFEKCQKQSFKELKQLLKSRQNQIDPELQDRIVHLQSIKGKIEDVIENIQKQQFQEKIKEIGKLEEKRAKKIINTVVPLTGFEWTASQSFDFDSIQQYENRNYSGGFKVTDFQNIDLAPTRNGLKYEEQ